MNLTEDQASMSISSFAPLNLSLYVVKSKSHVCSEFIGVYHAYPNSRFVYSPTMISLIELVILSNTSIASSVNVPPTSVALVSIADCA